MFGSKDKQKTPVVVPTGKPDVVKKPQGDTDIPPCINRMNPVVKMEMSGVQLAIEHAWEEGYKVGSPGFFLKLFTALLGSGIISLFTVSVMFVLRYVAASGGKEGKSDSVQAFFTFSQQELIGFIVGFVCLVFGGVLCMILQARKPTKDSYVKDAIEKLKNGD